MRPAALFRGRALEQISGRSADFAAGGKSLQHPSEQEEQGCNESDGGVGGRKRNDAGTRRHQEYGQGQSGFSPGTVAEIPDEHRAQRPHDETQAKDEKGFQEPRIGSVAGKEISGDISGEQGIDREIVPLEHVADRGCGDRAGFAGQFAALQSGMNGTEHGLQEIAPGQKRISR